MNLASILASGAGSHPARTALLVSDERVSYGDLEARSQRLAGALRRRGVERGDRVALRLPNGATFVAALFAALRLGAIAVPLNPLLAPPEVDARLAAATPVTILGEEDEPLDGEPFEEVVTCADVEPAALLFTSGTSGRPKAAVLTHGGIAAAAAGAGSAMAFGPDDVTLGAAPFSHVLGLSTGIFATLGSGGAIAVERRFDPERTLAWMTSTRTSILLGVPTMCIALCQAAPAAAELPPLRIAHVGGAPLPVEVGREFEGTFGSAVYEGYGLTEMSGIATTYVGGQRRKPGSVGMTLDGTEIRIDDGDVGEVQFRGPSVTAGYWNDATATAAAISSDGWLSTGDVGYLDDEGYLFLVDRKGELILRGGYNVHPREVEDVLYAHPDVLEAAVVGVPHATLGEEVAAVIVLRPGSQISTEALQAWAMERLARYKYPRHVAFVDGLPKGPTGKILKRALDRSSLGAETS